MKNSPYEAFDLIYIYAEVGEHDPEAEPDLDRSRRHEEDELLDDPE